MPQEVRIGTEKKLEVADRGFWLSY